MAPMFRVFPNTPEDYIGGGGGGVLSRLAYPIYKEPSGKRAPHPPTCCEALNPKVLTQIAQGQEGFKKGFCLGYSSGASEGRAS